MPMVWARALEFVLAAWVGCGAVFAVAFLVRGVGRIDPLAVGAPWGFRLLIAPGVVAFWPLLAARWLRATGQPTLEVNAHRRAARADRGDAGEARA